jgi:ribosome biogenesis protein MAK21
MKRTMPTDAEFDELSDSGSDDDDYGVVFDEDDDEVPSGLDDDSEADSDDESIDDELGDDEEVEFSDDDEDLGSDSDALSLAEGSDNEDLVPLDEIPDGLIEYDGSDASDAAGDDGEWGGIDGGASKNLKRKRKGDEESSSKGKRKKRKLPTFASYEDYAKMIEDGPEDDI